MFPVVYSRLIVYTQIYAAHCMYPFINLYQKQVRCFWECEPNWAYQNFIMSNAALTQECKEMCTCNLLTDIFLGSCIRMLNKVLLEIWRTFLQAFTDWWLHLKNILFPCFDTCNARNKNVTAISLSKWPWTIDSVENCT